MKTRITYRVGAEPWIRRTGHQPRALRPRDRHWTAYLAQGALVFLTIAAIVLALAAG